MTRAGRAENRAFGRRVRTTWRSLARDPNSATIASLIVNMKRDLARRGRRLAGDVVVQRALLDAASLKCGDHVIPFVFRQHEIIHRARCARALANDPPILVAARAGG